MIHGYDRYRAFLLLAKLPATLTMKPRVEPRLVSSAALAARHRGL